MHGKQLGNWEGTEKFSRKHLVNSWKLVRILKKHMGVNTCRKRGIFLKKKKVRPRKWKAEKGGEQPKCTLSTTHLKFLGSWLWIPQKHTRKSYKAKGEFPEILWKVMDMGKIVESVEYVENFPESWGCSLKAVECTSAKNEVNSYGLGCGWALLESRRGILQKWFGNLMENREEFQKMTGGSSWYFSKWSRKLVPNSASCWS